MTVIIIGWLVCLVIVFLAGKFFVLIYRALHPKKLNTLDRWRPHRATNLKALAKGR